MLTIGRLAQRVNLSTVTIRYYEKKGLIPKAKRTAGGYRIYLDSIISQFQFIKNAKAVGFTIEEIKLLLSFQQKNNATSKLVKSFTLQKINEIREKIKILRQIEKVLGSWADACDGKVSVEECPIMRKLYSNTKISNS